MPFDPPTDPSDDTPESPATHEKAVDLLMQDRAMISRMLREHQMLHEAFQHSPMVAAIHDPDGRPILWNKLYDRFHAEAIEFDVRGTLKPDEAPQECDYGNDEIYRAHDYALPNGMVARVAAPISMEKTCEAELQRASDAAQAADLAQADFLANVSHEIRTPLNGLLGMANLLAESGLTKGQQMYADVMLRSSEALLAITDDILDLTRIGTSGFELASKSFDIADSIGETATLFAANADEKGLGLIVRIDPVLPLRLIGDESRLRQIVANLLGNAIRFTETGHILLDLDAKMGTREDGRRVARLTCRVRDTGIGIAPALCDSMFDRSAPADADLGQSRSGAGLGLTVAAALVEKMGGRMGVDSIEGAGATFHFTVELPVDASDTTRIADGAVRGKRILVVDSEAVHSTVVAESVGAWGFEIVSCKGSREALALMDEIEMQGDGVDLVLLGEKIAEGEASLFTGALAGRPGSLPPVILMARLSALTMCDADEAKGIHLAATLPRPVQARCLLETIEHALRAGPRARLALPEAEFAPLAEAEPDADDAGHEAQMPLPPALPEKGAGALDILVAEDNEINQLLIDELLRQTGYTYRIVGDGSAALEAWRKDRPRLILMDVSMPVMSGDDATKRIRAEEEGKTRTPIVAVTAHALRGDRERCLRAGMDDHLTKPVTIASINKVVDFHLRPGETAATA